MGLHAIGCMFKKFKFHFFALKITIDIPGAGNALIEVGHRGLPANGEELNPEEQANAGDNNRYDGERNRSEDARESAQGGDHNVDQ